MGRMRASLIDRLTHKRLNAAERDAMLAARVDRQQCKKMLEIAVRRRAEQAQVAKRRIPLEFTQFVIGGIALESAVMEGELSEAIDWAAWSLTVEVNEGQVQSVEAQRIETFLLHPGVRSWPHVEDALLRWLTNFFYLVRARAAMREVAMALWGFSTDLLRSLNDKRWTGSHAELAAMLLGWAEQEAENHSREWAPFIERVALQGHGDPSVKPILIGSLASRAARYTQRGADVWASMLLMNHSTELPPHERLRLLSTLLASRYDQETKRLVLEAIDEIQAKASDDVRRTLRGWRALDAYASTILVICGTALNHGELDYLVEVLKRWYRISAEGRQVHSESLVCFAPFWQSGFLVVTREARHLLEFENLPILERLTAACNRFTGTSISVAGAEDDELHVPDRFGVPLESFAEQYEQSLVEAFCSAWALSDIYPTLPSDAAQLLIAPSPHPVQAVQLRHCGRTWPIVASLCAPRPDRTVKRVAFWSGAGSLTEEIETDLVGSIFRGQGTEVVFYAPHEGSAEEFLEMYTDPSFDVVWVASHGAYDHWNPTKIEFQIARDSTHVNVDDLLERCPVGERRRLLVMNVCDGARFEQIGPLPRIGLAAALASQHQAVISHLWPVANVPAVVFGALLASHLRTEALYFEAFRCALQGMRARNEEIANELRKHSGKAIEFSSMLERSAVELGNLAHSGSAAFFQ